MNEVPTGTVIPGAAPTVSNSPKPFSWLLLLVSVLAGIVAAFLLGSLSHVPREACFMGGIFVLAALLWVTEALPLFATSLLIIGLQILLLANPGNWPGLGFEKGQSPSYRDILSLATDPVIVLFFGGFVLAQAAVNEKVDRAMSSVLLRPFGTRPRWVLLGVMLITLLFSMWMSNTATATMMLALVMPMVHALPSGEPFRKALVLAVPFMANIGGMGTPIASPPNAVAIGYLQDAGHPIPFLKWMLVATPMALILTAITWMALCRTFKPVITRLEFVSPPERLTPRAWVVVSVFTVTVLLWMTDRWHGLPASAVALFPAIVLTATGLFTGADLGRLEWRILILIAGGISLGYGLQQTGLDRTLVGWLPTAGTSGPWLIPILVFATWIVGSFISNTAVANLFLPMGMSAATLSQGQLHPVQAALSIVLTASLSMTLPISTPPNAIAFAQGEFTARDMARMATLIGVAGVLMIIGGGPWIMRFWGLLH